MVNSRPSAVDSAAANAPAATSPEMTYGRPAISGVASRTTSGFSDNSASCRMPSPLISSIDTSPILPQEVTQIGNWVMDEPTRLE